MTTYLISYDLARPEEAKHAVASQIMALGEAWARPLDATWYVRSEEDAEDIEARLRLVIADEDGLVVQPVKGAAAMANTSLRWFKKRAKETGEPTSNVVAFPVIPRPIPTTERDLPIEPAALAG